MALNIVGAGFGRTGTLSLKLALEKLGFGRSYHMLDVYKHPDHAALWSAGVEGKAIDWEALLSDYSAVVDWPGCYFWRELSNTYPMAKVILTVRDSEKWYKSMYETIYQSMQTAQKSGDKTVDNPIAAMAKKIIMTQTFDGRFEEKAYSISVYERHNEEVQRTISKEKLLVYDISQGWEPLCHFLRKPVPDVPFPKTNLRETFHRRLGRSSSLFSQ
ncbi:MAG: hypothetical protein MRJ65_08160 [Candidatus Brocadiaceae bacterium]|nr:hypothetical protein [Candidatus Brocadiaceae bacterium]